MANIGIVAQTIDVVLSLPTNSASIVDNISNAINDQSWIDIASDGAQVVATVIAVAAVVEVATPAAVIAAATGK